LENTFHLVPEFIVLEFRLRPKPLNLSQNQVRLPSEAAYYPQNTLKDTNIISHISCLSWVN